jgi:hypothetical protein
MDTYVLEPGAAMLDMRAGDGRDPGLTRRPAAR